MSAAEAGDREGVRESEIRRIARLAGLSLTDREVAELAADMSTVLGHFREMRRREAGDGGGTVEAEPGGGGVPGHTADARARDVLRSDDPGPDPLRRRPEAVAPEWREGFFVVPQLAALGGAGEEKNGGGQEKDPDSRNAGASPAGKARDGNGGGPES